MYRNGDYVMKMNTGLCRIVDISCPEGMGIDHGKKYYHMVPLEDVNASIYVPVDREKVSLEMTGGRTALPPRLAGKNVKAAARGMNGKGQQ